MIAVGFSDLISSSLNPDLENAPGLQASITTSAQAINFFAISTPESFLRSISMLSLEVLKVAKNWDIFSPKTSSLKGPLTRRGSSRPPDSMRTTSAPWSANALAVIGPTPTQEKSATLSPSRGSIFLLIALFCLGFNAFSSRLISSPCSSIRGGRRSALRRSPSTDKKPPGISSSCRPRPLLAVLQNRRRSR